MCADVAVTAAVDVDDVAGAAVGADRTIETGRGDGNADSVDSVDAAVADTEDDCAEAAEATAVVGMVKHTVDNAAEGRCLCGSEALVDEDDGHRSSHGKRAVAAARRRSHRWLPSAAVHLVSEGAMADLTMVWQVRMQC